MNVLIIEDEITAREHLIDLMEQSRFDVTVVQQGSTVKDAIDFIKNENAIELIFLDIHLADGLAFDIFKKVKVNAPIIFTTAFDEYLLEAFEVQSIGYLLKPITLKKLEEAIEKHVSMATHYQKDWQHRVEKLLEANTDSLIQSRKRILVKVGLKFKPIDTENIAAFFRDELVYLVTDDGSKYPINQSLDVLEKQFHSSEFIRLNRKILVRKSFISKLEQLTGSKLLVSLKIELPFEVTVSQEKASWVKENLDA